MRAHYVFRLDNITAPPPPALSDFYAHIRARNKAATPAIRRAHQEQANAIWISITNPTELDLWVEPTRGHIFSLFHLTLADLDISRNATLSHAHVRSLISVLHDELYNIRNNPTRAQLAHLKATKQNYVEKANERLLAFLAFLARATPQTTLHIT